MKGEGDRVSGVYTGTSILVSGKYAVIENAYYEFTLVPRGRSWTSASAARSAAFSGTRASPGISRARGAWGLDVRAKRVWGKQAEEWGVLAKVDGPLRAFATFRHVDSTPQLALDCFHDASTASKKTEKHKRAEAKCDIFSIT